jgi:serine/threonine-protein kinase
VGADAPDGDAASAARISPTSPDPLIGRVINDRFRIVATIARGGMGKVYRAEQASLGREVALKVLNPNYSGDSDPEFHKRFFLEASITAKLTHPNTVSIFDYGRTDDGIYYIAMELLEGKTLHRAIREAAPFDPARALHIARQICRSLREAHGLGVIHRDLKPANVFLVRHGDESDFVKVLDFGLVKNVQEKGEDLTQTGLFMGSPKYMSPEQIRGERVDARADIYALGVILYEMLTGKVPFDRSNSVNILMAHVHEPPPPMRNANPNAVVPPAIEQVVMKCLEKEPAARFASMDELLLALKQASTESGHDLGISRELSGQFRTSAITGPVPALTGDALARSASGSGPVPSVNPSGTSAPHGVTVPPPSGDVAPRSPLPLVIAGLSLAVLLGVGLVALHGGDPGAGGGRVATSTETETAPAATPSTRTGPEPETPAAPAPGLSETGASAGAAAGETAVLRTIVTLRSEPPGATVTVRSPDGIQRTYGPTPAEVEWIGEEATRGREVTLRFELEGYRDFTVTRRIMGDHLEVSARLDAESSVRPQPRRQRGPVEGPVGPIQGYKMDPY